MRPHHNLDVWKKAVDLTVRVYAATEGFPKEEKFGLTQQVRRAAVSIAANIAEGAGRKSRREFSRFLSIAQGSASEVETELLIAFRLGYIAEQEYRNLIVSLNEVGRMITGLRNYLKKRTKTTIND